MVHKIFSSYQTMFANCRKRSGHCAACNSLCRRVPNRILQRTWLARARSPMQACKNRESSCATTWLKPWRRWTENWHVRIVQSECKWGCRCTWWCRPTMLHSSICNLQELDDILGENEMKRDSVEINCCLGKVRHFFVLARWFAQ